MMWWQDETILKQLAVSIVLLFLILIWVVNAPAPKKPRGTLAWCVRCDTIQWCESHHPEGSHKGPTEWLCVPCHKGITRLQVLGEKYSKRQRKRVGSTP